MKGIIYIATGNKSKLASFKLYFSWIDPEIQIELVPEYVDVAETGQTLADNSKLKVLPYLKKYDNPIIANDAGLFFDATIVEIQDPVKVKRNALEGRDENEFSQQEIAQRMINYYGQLARKYGGSIDCQMKDVYTMLLPDGTVFQEESIRNYQLIDRQAADYDIYHPLNSLRVSKLTGKIMDQMEENEKKIDKGPMVVAIQRLLSKLS